jgi:exodeoxyribonuclease VII small subunit
MNFDEAISKAETIIAQLEQAQALSMDEYTRMAGEATALLKQCKAEIDGMEQNSINI